MYKILCYVLFYILMLILNNIYNLNNINSTELNIFSKILIFEHIKGVVIIFS